MSCSYDKKIKVWKYKEDEPLYETIEKKDELRCMDIVSESGTLLVGTNTHAILTHSITDLINYVPSEQQSINMYGQIGYDMSNMDSDEEHKYAYADYDDEDNQYHNNHHNYGEEDKQDNFDYNGDELVLQNVMSVEEVMRN